MSLGTSPNPLISSTTKGLETNKWKCIVADELLGKTESWRLCRRRCGDRCGSNGYSAMGAGKAGAKEYTSI